VYAILWLPLGLLTMVLAVLEAGETADDREPVPGP
jgi:hypothetical protein